MNINSLIKRKNKLININNKEINNRRKIIIKNE